MTRPIPQVGAPDPERETSPILDEEDAGELDFDAEIEAPACRFNGVPYEIGDYVLSGSELLHCVQRGVWTRVGEMRREDRDIGARA